MTKTIKTNKMRTFDRYKQNLKMINNDVYSYNTIVAERIGKYLYKLRWRVNGICSSPTTSKHINYVAKELGLTVIENGQRKDDENVSTNAIFSSINITK